MKFTIFFLIFFTLSCQEIQNTLPETKTEEKPKSIAEIAPLALESISVANVVVKSSGDEEITYQVEVANQPETLEKGLQFRDSLGEQSGMWFIFEETHQGPFWTKDTYFSVDMIFVDESMNIVDIIKNVPPEEEEYRYSSKPYRYVLEVNGGQAEKNNFQLGDLVEYRLGPKN